MSAEFTRTPKQIEATELLTGPALHVLLYGGARSGKSLLFLRALVIRAARNTSRHVIFRKHFATCKTSIWLETWPQLMQMWAPDLPDKIKEHKTDYYWEFPNGSEIWIAGLDERERTEKILGKEYSTLMFEECSELQYESIQIALTRLAEKSGLKPKCYYSENPPMRKHWSYLLFIEKKNPLTSQPLARPEQYVSLRMNPADNRQNLTANYIEDILDNLSERGRKRFRDGEWLDDVEGALWNQAMISAYRVEPKDCPDMVRVVTGVDPMGSTASKKAEAGIVTAGQGTDGHWYVLLDASKHGTPLEWGRAAIAAHKDSRGDRVVAENNYGGEMVENTLRNIEAAVPYRAVNATRGKVVRAEPISARYEQGLVHHVGMFPQLEDEMCSYLGLPGEKSPNRLDALVWTLTELGATISPTVSGGGIPSKGEKDKSEIVRLMAMLPAEEQARMREELKDVKGIQ
jgi:hypothetical protein